MGKHGFTDSVLETYWSIHTYATDSEGYCYGRYNPQVKLSEDGKRSVINFEWMFEATEENKQKLIDEVYRLASSVTGMNATEKRIEKSKEWAKEQGYKIVYERPEGFIDLPYHTPINTVVISNDSNWRNRDREKYLLFM